MAKNSTDHITKEQKREIQKSKRFREDIPNMILLIILYGFQGLPMGLFLKTIPVLFKQYLSYQEVGVIMMATMPYSFKFVWAPIIEIYYLSFIGKRKSWIIPTQLIGTCILVYLHLNVLQLLQNKEVYFLSGIMIFNTFVITCQDIAVDSWAVEILHPCNSTYASACQSVGLRTGMGISTTIFMALNTVEFCNRWIFPKDMPREEPLVNIPDFIFYWAIIQFLITLYILFFVPEKVKYDTSDDDLSDLEEEEEEIMIKPNQIFGITWDILKNPNFLYFMIFLLFTYAAVCIENSIAMVYMTNDLKFSKESLSSIKIISVPANFICTFLSSYLSRDRPFALMVNVTLLYILTCSYMVFVLLGTFPTDQETQQSPKNIFHVTATTMACDLSSNLWFVTLFAILFKIVDKRITGIHITLLASLTNQCQFVHKFYIFDLVERLGIFIPQGITMAVSLICLLAMQSKIRGMDDLPVESWYVSDEVIFGKKVVEEAHSGKKHSGKKQQKKKKV